jgi:tetratricopeptide (TPR) repeat protein
MDESPSCPNCGREHPANSPMGLCPRCLLQQGMGELELRDSEPQTRFAQPSPYRASCPSSVLSRIEEWSGPFRRVSLRETEITNGCAADCGSGSSEAQIDQPGERSDRYLFFGEIARGGMGAVLRGRDIDLGRELAVKVLLESHMDKPELVRRFVEEARIGGQLQHPGVVPVYELGTFADNRPFFTMKLVRGRTLAQVLRARPAAEEDRSRLLAIFESICQTMAYAHARGVIHRDLKPSNIMVGDYGEVQVMDWGLAKVLADENGNLAEGGPNEPSAGGPSNSPGTTSSGPRASSLAGSILGTPGYMAPEQARGQVELVDERADVFGLGAILCEILTGRPIDTGPARSESEYDVSRWDFDGISVRLSRCGADAELIELTRQCLALEPKDRPRQAGFVAARIAMYLSGVQNQLRQTELARVEADARAEEEAKRRLLSDELAHQAQARATEERRRRRLALALAGAILVLGTFVAGLSTVYFQQRHNHLVRLNSALQEFELRASEARSDPDGDPAKWHAAVESIRRAESLLGPFSDGDREQRVKALRSRVVAAESTAQGDQALLRALVDIRSAWADDADGSMSDLAYSAAFRDSGLDVDALGAEAAGALIKKRPPSLALALAAGLDDWASQRRRFRPGAADDWIRLSATARAADADPVRDQLRRLWAGADQKAHRKELAGMAAGVDFPRWPRQSLVLLATVLSDSGDREGAAAFLRRAQTYHPDDVWINYGLARQLEDLEPPQTDEAIQFYRAARALRPETAHELAHALDARGRGDEAVAILEELTSLRPESGRHWMCLGALLKERGDGAAARAASGRAVAALRAAVGRSPERAEDLSDLGAALHHAGNPVEAIALYREAIRLKPELARAHDNLGAALAGKGQTDLAIAEYRATIRLRPNFANAHNNLAIALRVQGKLAEAIAEYREALRLKPDFARARYNLAEALREHGQLDHATAELREAIRRKPDFADAHAVLGGILCGNGEHRDALVEFTRAHEIGSKQPDWPYPTDLMIKKTERILAIEKRLAGVVRGHEKPADPAEALEFAADCYRSKRYATCATLAAAALETDPKLALNMDCAHRYNAACAAALAAAGKGIDQQAPDERMKIRWRKQALLWLTADLAHWSEEAHSATSERSATAIKALEHWKADPGLAGVRGEAALRALPADEREGWKRLWDQLDLLLGLAASPRSPVLPRQNH